MLRAGWALQGLAAIRLQSPGALSRLLATVIVAALVFFACLHIFNLFGLPGLTVTLVVLVAFTLLAVLSLQNLQLAVLVWIIAISGFRGMLIVDLPGMPDATPDRLILIWIIFAVLIRSFTVPSRPLPPYWPDVLMTTHTLYLLGSCLIANPVAFNMWTRSYLMPCAAFFFGKYLMSDLTWFQRMIRLLIALNLYMGFTSVAEHMHWTAVIWPKEILDVEVGYIGRSLGIFHQPGVLGIFLGMILPFQFYLHFAERRIWLRWLHLGGILLCVAGLFFTYTRGPWLATTVGLVVLAVTGRRVYMQRLFTYAVFTAVIGATGLLSLKQDAFLQERMGNENTIEGRINLAVTAFRMWQSNPVLGVGFKRFNDLASNYRETVEVPIYGLIKMGIDKDSSPHDIYVAVLAEEGIVGAGIQLWIYILAFRVAMGYLRRQSQWHREDPRIFLVPPILALMATYFVGGTAFDYRFFETPNSLFYTFVGVLIGWSGTWTRNSARIRSVPN